jgi:hypothetical protein
MTTSTPGDHDAPPRPAADADTWREFGSALRSLRESWARLTLQQLADAHPALKVSTISDHENGKPVRRYEWLGAHVTVCLRAQRPAITRDQIDAEMHHWRDAWTRLGQAPNPLAVPPPRAAPVAPEAADDAAPTPAPVAPAAANEPAPTRRRVRLPRRRVLLISGAAVALVVAAAVYATATGLFEREPGPGLAQFASPPAQAVPVHASGTVDDLGTKEGIDLDTGQRRGQDDPGVDISFSSASTHMDAMDERVYYQEGYAKLSLKK